MRTTTRARIASIAVAVVAAGALSGAPPAGGAPDRVEPRAKPPKNVLALTFEPDSVLYRVRTRTGKSTEIGATGAQLTDVARRGKKLYAIGFGTLYELDTETGESTRVGSLGVSDANALTMRPKNRRLYGASIGGWLFRIDHETGATTVIGEFGRSLGSSGDLAFRKGRLYATVSRNGRAKTLLAKVNVRTGKAKVVGKTGFKNVYGLVAAKGRLFGGAYNGKLIAISAKTGKGRRISSTDLEIGGMTK
ncbi:hypothetical protein [Nocardioides sp. YIM 152588]|uniref:DUF6923 family protein n=1 Tax=Nocardioides sp. YIM 152588 TaxID=3158259 RepID=UPI0032E3C981